MIRTIITLCFLLLVSNVVFATSGTPHVIFYKGQKWDLFSYVIEKNTELVKALNVVIERNNGVRSTANYEGYLATFEVKDKMLYLIDITVGNRITDSDGRSNYIRKTAEGWEDVFEKYKTKDGILVDWVKDFEIRLGQGATIIDRYLGFWINKEREVKLLFKDGKLVKSTRARNLLVRGEDDLITVQKEIQKNILMEVIQLPSTIRTIGISGKETLTRRGKIKRMEFQVWYYPKNIITDIEDKEVNKQIEKITREIEKVYKSKNFTYTRVNGEYRFLDYHYNYWIYRNLNYIKP
ncbi:MAG: hypothetical protein ACRDDZ_01150 [Marinifilaceae bacterium]